jgi:hypothetical protein
MITIPNINNVHPTTDIVRKPAQAKSGVTNPCPLGIAATGTTGSGGALCEPTNARAGYYGYNVRPNVPAGASADDEAYACIVGGMVDGFSGVQPRAEVFIDPTARPTPEGTFSGLTHTVPAGGIGEAIGVGVTTTKIWFYSL